MLATRMLSAGSKRLLSSTHYGGQAAATLSACVCRRGRTVIRHYYAFLS
jgi:hypothetical protein